MNKERIIWSTRTVATATSVSAQYQQPHRRHIKTSFDQDHDCDAVVAVVLDWVDSTTNFTQKHGYSQHCTTSTSSSSSSRSCCCSYCSCCLCIIVIVVAGLPFGLSCSFNSSTDIFGIIRSIQKLICSCYCYFRVQHPLKIQCVPFWLLLPFRVE